MSLRAFAAAVIAVAALATATLADAELTARGDLLIRFDGGIAPRSLPRTGAAPISVRAEGTIRVAKGAEPPAVRRISIAINKGGRLDPGGLPVCRRSQIDPATPSEALAACGGALVGGGGFTGVASFPEQARTPVRGEILLFNSRADGHPAVLAHVYQRSPGPITTFLEFRIRRTAGTFGTVITASLPEDINRDGYLKSIFLQLQRRYVRNGRSRSYLMASCPAPPGFRAAVFPFARASMTFADGRTLSSTLIRTCSVR